MFLRQIYLVKHTKSTPISFTSVEKKIGNKIVYAFYPAKGGGFSS